MTSNLAMVVGDAAFQGRPYSGFATEDRLTNFRSLDHPVVRISFYGKLINGKVEPIRSSSTVGIVALLGIDSSCGARGFVRLWTSRPACPVCLISREDSMRWMISVMAVGVVSAAAAQSPSSQSLRGSHAQILQATTPNRDGALALKEALDEGLA
jgi:hypothetical protein